jgi:hypothetical protein
MKKLLTIIVPLALLVGFASIGLADEDNQELNQELNKEISSVPSSQDQAREGIDDGDSGLDDAELNSAAGRDESRSIALRRGRQPRRGQTASDLSDVQKYWGDHNSGKSADEDYDEDEDDDQTPVYP